MRMSKNQLGRLFGRALVFSALVLALTICVTVIFHKNNTRQSFPCVLGTCIVDRTYAQQQFVHAVAFTTCESLNFASSLAKKDEECAYDNGARATTPLRQERLPKQQQRASGREIYDAVTANSYVIGVARDDYACAEDLDDVWREETIGSTNGYRHGYRQQQQKRKRNAYLPRCRHDTVRSDKIDTAAANVRKRWACSIGEQPIKCCRRFDNVTGGNGAVSLKKCIEYGVYHHGIQTVDPEYTYRVHLYPLDINSASNSDSVSGGRSSNNNDNDNGNDSDNDNDNNNNNNNNIIVNAISDATSSKSFDEARPLLPLTREKFSTTGAPIVHVPPNCQASDGADASVGPQLHACHAARMHQWASGTAHPCWQCRDQYNNLHVYVTDDTDNGKSIEYIKSIWCPP